MVFFCIVLGKVKFSYGNWIDFYYDGRGVLLKRKLSNCVVWKYIDDLVIKNDTLYQINQDEGRVIYDTPTDKYTYEFEYRDHLGNLCVSFRDSLATPVGGVYKPPVVVQVDDYDPWGLEITAFQQNIQNNFKFQKQGRINDFNLNVDFFKYRVSDPTIGRFWQIDALADKYVHNSVYAFSEKKVTGHIELDGLEAINATMYSNTVQESGISQAQRSKIEVKTAILGASMSDVNDATVMVTTFTRG